MTMKYIFLILNIFLTVALCAQITEAPHSGNPRYTIECLDQVAVRGKWTQGYQARDITTLSAIRIIEGGTKRYMLKPYLVTQRGRFITIKGYEGRAYVITAARAGMQKIDLLNFLGACNTSTLSIPDSTNFNIFNHSDTLEAARTLYQDSFNFNINNAANADAFNIRAADSYYGFNDAPSTVSKYQFKANMLTLGDKGFTIDYDYNPSVGGSNFASALVVDADLGTGLTNEAAIHGAWVSVGGLLVSNPLTDIIIGEFRTDLALTDLGTIVGVKSRPAGSFDAAGDIVIFEADYFNNGTVAGDVYGFQIKDINQGTINGTPYGLHQAGSTNINMMEGHIAFNGLATPLEEVHIQGSGARLRFDNNSGINWGGSLPQITGSNTVGWVVVATDNYRYSMGRTTFGIGNGTFGAGNAVDVSVIDEIGSTLGFRIFNADNTNAASHTSLKIMTGGTSSGNPYILFGLAAGGDDWTFGMDNTDSDILKWSNSTILGTNTRLSLTPAGRLTIANEVSIGDFMELTPTATVPGTPATGTVYMDDGTNAGGTPTLRYYNGTIWINL